MTDPPPSSTSAGRPGSPPSPGPGHPAEPAGPGLPTAAEAPMEEPQGDPDAGAAPGPGGADRREEAATGSAAQELEGDPTAWPPDEAFDAVDLDDREWTRRDLEAILLVADQPVPAPVLAEIVGSRLSEVEELLVDLDQRSLVQLQHGKQADHDIDRHRLAADQVLEAAGPAVLEAAGEVDDGLGDRQPGRRDVGGGDLRWRRRGEGRGGQAGQLLRGDPDEQVGHDATEEVLGADPPGHVGRLLGQPGAEETGDLLVGPVLEDPGEEQVPFLEDGLDLVGVGVRGG